jgi:hypothetical protein
VKKEEAIMHGISEKRGGRGTVDYKYYDTQSRLTDDDKLCEVRIITLPARLNKSFCYLLLQKERRI